MSTSSEITWKKRENDEQKDLQTLYGEGNTRYFSIEINYPGGYDDNVRRYYSEKIVIVDFLDINDFTEEYIHEIVFTLGCGDIYELTTCHKDLSFDLGIIALSGKKAIKIFIKRVKTEGFYKLHKIHAHGRSCFYFPRVKYPDTLKTAPKEILAKLLKEHIEDYLMAHWILAQNFIDREHGVQLSKAVLKPAIKYARDKLMLNSEFGNNWI